MTTNLKKTKEQLNKGLEEALEYGGVAMPNDVLRIYLIERDAAIVEAVKGDLKEKIQKLIDENDDGMWTGRETADTIRTLIENYKIGE